MKKYTKPEMELARFECEDILALSSVPSEQTKTETGSTGVDIVNVATANAAVNAAVSPFDPMN